MPAETNPLDAMSWEERFMFAWAALCAMEARAENAERKLREFSMPFSEWIVRNKKQAELVRRRQSCR